MLSLQGGERWREGHKKCHQTCSAAGRSCSTFAFSFSFFPFFCVNVSAATLPILPSPSFDVCLIAWPMKKKTHTPTPTTTRFLVPVCLRCCVWLASAARRVKGRGPPHNPLTPLGKPEAPRPKQGSSPKGPRRSLSALLIARSSLGGMCNDM